MSRLMRNWLLVGSLCLFSAGMSAGVPAGVPAGFSAGLGAAPLHDDLTLPLPRNADPLYRLAPGMLPWGPCGPAPSACNEAITPLAAAVALLSSGDFRARAGTGQVHADARAALQSPARWAALAQAGLPLAFRLWPADDPYIRAPGAPGQVTPDAVREAGAAGHLLARAAPPLAIAPALNGAPGPLVFTSADFAGSVSAAGATAIMLELLNERPLTLAEVRAGPVSGAPVPATWLLLVAGLAVLFGWRRRQARRADGARSPAAALPALVPALVCLALLGACNEGFDPEAAVAAAQTRLDADDLPAAAELLRRLLVAEPEHVYGRWLYAELNARIGDYAAAEKEYRRALADGMSPNSVLVPLAFSLLMQERTNELLRFTPAGALLPEAAADLAALKAVAALAQGDEEALAAALETARGGNQVGVFPALAEARGLATSGRLREARERVDQTLETAPAQGHAWHLCGQLAAADGDRDRAAACYEAAARRGPWQPQWLYDHALSLLAQGRIGAAEPVLARLLHLTPHSAPTHFALGRWLLALGLPERAVEHFELVLRVKPEHAETRYSLALAQLAAGAVGSAEAHLRHVLDRVPTAWPVRKRLAELLLERGDYAGLRRLVLPAVRTGQADAAGFTLYAGALVGLGEAAEAEAVLRRLVAREPGAAAVRERLAMALLAAGNLDAAIREQSLATDLAPTLLEGERRLIHTLLGRGRSDEALARALAQQARLPGRPEPLLVLGEVHAARGDFATAAAELAAVPERTRARRAAVALLAEILPAAATDTPEAAAARVRALLTEQISLDPADVDTMLLLAALGPPADLPAFPADPRADQGDPAALEPRTRLLLRAFATAPYRLDVRLALARHWLDLQRPRDAIALLESGRAARPGEPHLVLTLGIAHLADGAAEAAWQLAARAQPLAPRDPAVHWLLARAGLALGRTGAAVTSLRDALALAPDLRPVRRDLVAALASQGDWAAAAGVLTPLRAAQPGDPAVTLLAGWVALGSGDAAGALPLLEVAWREGGSRAALLGRARTAAHLGRTDDALAHHRTWLAAHPNDHAARLALADLLAATGDRAGAVAGWEQVIAAQPDQTVALINLADALHAQAPARALTLARRAYDQAGDSPAVAATLARLLAADGDLVAAERILARTLARTPQAHGLALTRARLLLDAGRTNEAAAALAPLLTIDQQDPVWREAVYLLSSLEAAD